MMNPIAQRHLRDAPSAPIVRSFSEVPNVAGAQRSNPQQQPEGIRHIFLGERCLSTPRHLSCVCWSIDAKTSNFAGSVCIAAASM